MIEPDRRHPHQLLDPGILRGFLNGRRIRASHLLTGGRSNSNYRVELDDGTVCVVRLYSTASPSKESWVMTRAAQVVPVPRVLHVGDRLAVLEYLPGEPLTEHPECLGAAAQALARLSRITFSQPGQMDAGGNIVPWPFDAVGGFMALILAHAEVRRWLGADRLARLRSVLDKESPRLDDRAQPPCLVHGDYNPSNILIHEGEVSGILDWEYAHSGSPFMDIANLCRTLNDPQHETVREGLLRGGFDLPPDWRERCLLIDLSSHLEFLTSHRSDTFKRTRVDLVDRLLARFE